MSRMFFFISIDVLLHVQVFKNDVFVSIICRREEFVYFLQCLEIESGHSCFAYDSIVLDDQALAREM